MSWTANVRGRDLGGFVAEAQTGRREVEVPAGYWVEWGGSSSTRSRRAASAIVVPVALTLIFLLFTAFGSSRMRCSCSVGVPLALTGGVMALWLRGMPFSISAGVGFIALSGVAVLNGIVMVSLHPPAASTGRAAGRRAPRGLLTRLRRC